MTAQVRILTTKTVDSSPAILLVGPDGSKTLVNCGEGCQRSFLEYSQKLSTVNRVCLTHLAYDSVGGLPGMILTSADSAKAAQMDLYAASSAAGAVPNSPAKQQQQQKGKRNNNNNNKNKNCTLRLEGMELLGPKGTRQYIRSLRHFMRREEFPIHIQEGAYQEVPASNQEELSQKQRAKKKKRKRQESNTTSCDSSSTQDIESSADERHHRHHYFGIQSIPIDYDMPMLGNASSKNSTTNNKAQQQQVVSYLFTTPPISGKFLPEKAKELGIPPGPLYAQLKAGRSVTFEDAKTGTTRHVESSQVVLEPTPGVMVAILYYPTLEVWSKLQPEVDAAIRLQSNVKLELVIHMAPKQVMEAPECKEWRTANQQNDILQHVWMDTSDPSLWRPSSNHSPSPFTSACVGALVRSQIFPDVYKQPDYLVQVPKELHNYDNNSNLLLLKEDNMRSAESMLEYTLIPRSRKGYTVLPLSKDLLDTCIKDALDFASKSGALDRAKDLLKKENNPITGAIRSNGNNNGDHATCKAQLLFTGTGSAIPCKHRNVTGMCLRMEDGQAILLDVGEGTVGQLLRASSTLVDDDSNNNNNDNDNKDIVSSEILTYEHLLQNIKAVWVSHPHADHHLGLLRLLTDRQAIHHHHRRCSVAVNDEMVEQKNDRLVVIGPPPILDFLREYELVDPRIMDSYVGLDCRELQNSPNRPRNSMPRVMQENSLLGGRITSMEAIPVAHCAYSYAVVLEGTTFGKVAYSGDCRPSRNFARVALNADLLIHEATFENGMEAEATMKRHSTVGEAMDIARQMNAKTLVLTHFSQRYPKIPPVATPNKKSVDDNNGDGNSNSSSVDFPVIFAFDFMAIKPTNLQEAAQITPALRLLYPEEGGEEDTNEDPPAMAIPGFFAQDIH